MCHKLETFYMLLKTIYHKYKVTLIYYKQLTTYWKPIGLAKRWKLIKKLKYVPMKNQACEF